MSIPHGTSRTVPARLLAARRRLEGGSKAARRRLEGGEGAHEWAGYALAALAVLRIAWGCVGSRHARFCDFFPTPARLRRYLGRFPPDHEAWPGHNPLGALMVLVLWFMLLLTAVSGWMQEFDAFWGEEWLQRLHELTADAVMIAVTIHVAAVLLMQRLTAAPLIRAMITGRREAWRGCPQRALRT
jgi:cytochrome b